MPPESQSECCGMEDGIITRDGVQLKPKQHLNPTNNALSI